MPQLLLPNGQAVQLTDRITIGRSVDNLIKLDDGGVSRKHASVEWKDNRTVVTDLGSINGTWVNEQRIQAPTPLRNGDRVRVGGVTMLFQDAPDTVPAGAPRPADAPEVGATVHWQTEEPMTLLRGDGSEFGLSRSVRVGRNEANDLVLAGDTSASQFHAKIDVLAGQAIISDLNSRNGTWVNGGRIRGPTRLNHGAKILLGDTVFRLRVGAQPLPDLDSAGRAQPSRLGFGLLLGGGMLSIIGVGAIGVALLVAALVVLPQVFAPTPTPLAAATPRPDPAVIAATERANAEQQALRALVLVVAPVGDPRTTDSFSTGSGSLLSSEGYVLTNFHVIGNPRTGRYHNDEGWAGIGLNWTNPDSAPDSFYRCEIVMADKDLDLALLRVNALANGDPLPPDVVFPFLPVGNSDELKIGDAIAVLGFPGLGGDTPTFTRGTVAGFLIDNHLNLPRGWIKTDAEVNPGNSGGMAINDRGQLIGVPTQVFFGTDVTGKISEIRPINFAQPFIDAVP